MREKSIKHRCEWAGTDPLYIEYHDNEWGVPVHDDRKLFEFLILEGAQAGLSWITVLKKRENFRKAFDNFNPEKISKYQSEKIKELLNNRGIIRNKLKIAAAVQNASAFLKVVEKYGNFNDYIWQFTDGRQIQNSWKNESEIPAETKKSKKMSKDLKEKGFKFIGPTICYAFMQATGMINDHVVHCFRYNEIKHNH